MSAAVRVSANLRAARREVKPRRAGIREYGRRYRRVEAGDARGPATQPFTSRMKAPLEASNTRIQTTTPARRSSTYRTCTTVRSCDGR
jgi:hypothetical protein